MNSNGMIITAIAILAVSGVPALFGSRRSMTGQRCTAMTMIAGSGLGLWGLTQAVDSAGAVSAAFPWIPPIGGFSVSIDAIGIVFLAPIFVVPALGAVYGMEYWKQSEHSTNGRKLGLFYGMLAGSMALVVIARDAVLFLIAWEIMALAAYFAATVEDGNPAARRAGWVYLIATHIGTLCLIAMFALLRQASGSFALQPLAADGSQPAILSAIFVLSVIGFGFKAGLMPLHVWLPEAHSNAPSHVSAVMSGVMLKMGVYGIVRMAALLPLPPAWWGASLLGLGAMTGVLGIAFAVGQHDLKRALAYSSIENIGIIAMGTGLALLGRSMNRPDWIVLGLGGALLHVWNHGLFKSLLFLNAGVIVHHAHTRAIDRMGGLAKRMPRTALLFLIGAVAICALPPLNGFAGEWLICLGLLRTVGEGAGSVHPMAGLGMAVLATIGALAVACFVKLFGGVFLGEPRTKATAEAHDPGPSIALPMAGLAVGCVTLGLAPWLAAPMLDRAATAWSGAAFPLAQPIAAVAPMGWISVMALALIAATIALTALLKPALRRRVNQAAGTWDCGYARPTARMQYTGSSLGQSLTALFAWALWPQVQQERVKGSFPGRAGFVSRVPDAILDRLVLPVFRFTERCLFRLRPFQQGSIQIYIVYILAAALVMLLWGRFGLQP
jgi:hydrogenase-4 component B